MALRDWKDELMEIRLEYLNKETTKEDKVLLEKSAKKLIRQINIEFKQQGSSVRIRYKKYMESGRVG